MTALAALIALGIAGGVRVPTRRRTPIEEFCRATVATALADQSWREAYRVAFIDHGRMNRARADIEGIRWAA